MVIAPDVTPTSPSHTMPATLLDRSKKNPFSPEMN
jgi:hypothetical protein